MIISDVIQKYDNSYKIIRYVTKKGKSEPILDSPPVAGKEKLGDIYYKTKALENKRIIGEILKGEKSPIFLYMILQNLDERNLAHRLKISPGKVKKHLTIEGFKKITVETLIRYAQIFDISVSDFFVVLKVKDVKSLKIDSHLGRLIQEIKI